MQYLLEHYEININEKNISSYILPNNEIFNQYFLWNLSLLYIYETALFIASTEGFIQIVELLLASEFIDVNATNVANVSPLMMACYKNHEPIVLLLCQNERINFDLMDDNILFINFC